MACKNYLTVTKSKFKWNKYAKDKTIKISISFGIYISLSLLLFQLNIPYFEIYT